MFFLRHCSPFLGRNGGWCGWFVVLAAAVYAAPAARLEKNFDLPAGDAARTLPQFATQSGEQIVYMLDSVRGEMTHAVQGQLRPRDALERMLAGTALNASQDPGTGALVVGRRNAAPPVAPGASRPGVPPPSRPGASRPLPALAAEETPEAIVKLSPFAVSARLDTGYRATETLAGTRLRSDLRDLTASISVVTREFIEDVHATDLTSLLVYTLGTEVGGYGGNFSDLGNPEAQGVFDDALGQASPGTRVRGLINADRTRNYFLSDIPLDGYNIERIEISRGANANLFGLGSPAGIINAGLIAADLDRSATTGSTSFGSYHAERATLDHNQVLRPGRAALRLATVYDLTRFRPAFTHEKKRAATLTGTLQPTASTVLRVTSELGRGESNRPELRPPYDRYSWWWDAGRPVWDPAAPGGGAGRLLGAPRSPFTATTVLAPDGTRQPQNYLTANWGGSTANQPLLMYLDPTSSRLGGLPIGGGRTVDGVKTFAENSAINSAGTALVPAGLLGLNSRVVIEQNVQQADNPLRTLFSREPMLGTPAVFDFFHQTLGGPTKSEWSRWEAHNLTLEQTFLEQRAGLELALDRQRVDNGFTSPFSYAINLDPNERLPNGEPNPNFLRPVSLGGGFQRVYSQDRDALRLTGYYRVDARDTAGPRWLGRLLGRHLFNASYGRQDYLYQQFGGTPWNTGLDWRAFENLPLPGVTSSTARIVPVAHYLGGSVRTLATAVDVRLQGVTASQDPTGTPTMTLLTNQRPVSNAPSALNPWAPATFALVSNPPHDVGNTIRNAQRYADRLEQQVRSFSAVLQSHWLDGTLVTTAGWRRDQVWSFDAGLPGLTPAGTADVRWEVFSPRLTRTLAQSASSFGVVAHLPAAWTRRLTPGFEASAFYNSATNFRVAPQRYTITRQSLPAETGDTREIGVRVAFLGGRVELRAAHYETVADNATVSGLVAGINQLAMAVPQVIEHNALGDNADNPGGIAAFEAWLESPAGQTYRRAFDVILTPAMDVARPTSLFGQYASATGDRGQIAGVSALRSQGLELELTLHPMKNWRLSANAASAEAVRTHIAPELRDFLFNRTTGLVRLVQNPDGSPTDVGRLVGTPVGGGAASLQSFIAGNVLNLGIVTAFAQEGTRTDELRRWSFRAVTNYTFPAEAFGGRGKGFGVGGAVRWAQAPVLGYAGKIENTGGTLLAVSDASRPFYGEAETTWDGWASYERALSPRLGWKLQLNVRNLGVGNELRPLAVWPDGRVIQWTIREPQRWTLTNTFTF